MKEEQVRTRGHDLLYKDYGHFAPQIENAIYELAEHHVSDYKGGLWFSDIYTNESGMKFPIFWQHDGTHTNLVTTPNDILPDCTRYAWGVAMTSLAINRLCWAAHENADLALSMKAANHYHAILDYVYRDDTLMNKYERECFHKLTD